MGCMAAGIEVCSMYPITPATSASHYLANVPSGKSGGFVHQAEDEIAAIGFAIGASYAGKTALTITSGPGLALKTESIGLAVMGEIPLVIVDVQRGGPSTGLPTKVEQGDLLAVAVRQPGETPKVVMAPSTIEECFHFMITARKLAESLPHAGDRADRRQPGDGPDALPAYPRSRRTGCRRRWTSPPGRTTCALRLGSRDRACLRGRSPASPAASTC